ncbi:MAG: hypothetical protein AB1815_03825 [Bacillota bacterium]
MKSFCSGFLSRWMRRYLGNEKGIALPMAVALVVIVSLLGASAAYMMESQTQMGSRFTAGADAMHYAEAGANNYLWRLNEGTEASAQMNVRVSFEGGFYRLQELQTSESLVTIRSTGWLASDPSSARTIDVTMRKRAFTQFAYLSNSDGPNIWWIGGERCYGPYHTNDTLRVRDDPIFFGRVTYVTGFITNPAANATDPAFLVQTFRDGIQQVTPLIFPGTNGELIIWAQNDDYYYRGRTSIRLNGDGTITTRNPNRNSGAAEIRSLPPSGVIYVDAATSGTTGKFGTRPGDAFVSGTLNGRLTIAAANDIYITGRDPTNYTFNNAAVTDGIRYAITTFSDVVQSGEKIGVSASNDHDMLGLVANNDVWILGTGWFSGNPADVAPDDITIHAALFAINGSFGYESYTTYTKGDINFVGSLIQRTRAPVGLFDATSGQKTRGYDKNYAYDPRMAFTAPPRFLQPAAAGWDVFSWEENSHHLPTE